MRARRDRSDHGRSAVDFAAQAICDRISTGRFVAGQRLPELDLVDQIGVSKTVLRETFAKLQQEGIIELQKYKGARVRRLSFDEFLEILAANTILMAWAAHEAANTISKEPGRRASLGAIRTRLQTFEPVDQRAHIAVFYAVVDTMVELAGSPYLKDLIGRGFNPLVKEFLLDSISFSPEVISHTRKLDRVIEHIENGEAEAAFNALRKWTKLERSWVRPPDESEK